MAEEKNFENRIKNFLKNNDIYYFKTFQNAFTKRGIPDIIACVNGYFVAVEVKATKGKASVFQLENKKDIEKNCGIHYLLYPEQFEKFKKDILDLKNKDKRVV